MTQPSDIQKTIAGALLIGGGILAKDGVLLAVAGGVGVNWVSEGVAGLWERARSAFTPGTALARAGKNAIVHAVDRLRGRYLAEVGNGTNTSAFDLVRECAGAAAGLDLKPGPDNPEALARTLARALDGLLHGHDERQVAFLKEHLLAAVSSELHAELARSGEAWRLFHGYLIAEVAARQATMGDKLDRFPEVLKQLADPSRALAVLQSATDQISVLVAKVQTALTNFQAPASPRNVYIGSAHSEGGGTAVVINAGNVASADAPGRRKPGR